MNEIKPLLRQMVDNNKPHWRPETIRGAHKQLDEYEAKAKAFDLIVEEIDSAGRTMASKQSLEQYATVNAFWNIDEIIVDYGRGEWNDKD